MVPTVKPVVFREEYPREISGHHLRGTGVTVSPAHFGHVSPAHFGHHYGAPPQGAPPLPALLTGADGGIVRDHIRLEPLLAHILEQPLWLLLSLWLPLLLLLSLLLWLLFIMIIMIIMIIIIIIITIIIIIIIIISSIRRHIAGRAC